MFWWDALAATSLVLGPRDDLVCYRLRPVSVVLDGPSSGRTIESPDGTPQLVGYTADSARFEATFTSTLNGGRGASGPRFCPSMITDLVMVYGLDDTTPQRIARWRDAGYRVHLMTGISWGAYQDYLDGRWDGSDHWADAQTSGDGSPILHGRSAVAGSSSGTATELHACGQGVGVPPRTHNMATRSDSHR